jgi:hypothetical protein
MKKEPQIPDKLFTRHGKDVERIFRRAVQEALWQSPSHVMAKLLLFRLKRSSLQLISLMPRKQPADK